MGYEMKLHIGRATPAMPELDAKYGRSILEIASIDLSGINGSDLSKLCSDAIDKQSQTDEFWTISTDVQEEREDGKTYEVNHEKDSYGLKIGVIPLEIVRDSLKKSFEQSQESYGPEGHRRFYIALQLVEAILDRFPEDELPGWPLVALTYGH